MILAENITKKYRGEAVLKGAHAAFPEGKLIAFIGGNGAGKSTMLNIISRLLPPSEGCVKIDAAPLGKWNSRELAKRLTILSQTLYTPARITVGELVSFGRFPHSKGALSQSDKEMIDASLELTGMSCFKGRFLDELSGGQRQMAYIAMSIAQDTKYLLLDEPLNNLDMSRSVKIMKILKRLVRERQKTVFIVIHDINFASFYADYVAAFKDGVLKYQGEASEIMRPEILSDIYGMDISVEECGGKKICLYYE